MARISVDSSAVSHNKNGEGGGGVTYVMGGSSKSGSYNSLTVQSINAANGNIDYLKSKSISANDMSMIYISAVDGTIQKLKGSSANFDQGYFSALGADTIDANKLTVKDIDAINAWIETLQSREITTEYLTVTKQAHFFELIIDKIRSVGGQLIITPASCTADYVWGVDSNDNLVPANTPNVAAYEIYWRATQDDGRTVTNDWIVNDQAICQSFNNVHQETNYNISNKYYWRLVTQVSGITPDYDDIYVNLATGALTTDPNASEATLKNEFEVVMYKTTSILNNVAYDNNISWECKAQELKDDEGHVIIPTNVKWDDVALEENEVIHGIFKSASQQYGIQIDPTITENLPATTNFQLQIKQKGADDTYSIIPENINIGVYFTDDTFLMWNDAPLDANGNFFFNMPDVNSAIRAIIVTSTADVKWHLCHRIRLSNNPAEMDNVLSGSFAIPSTGDNLIQLGYQGNDDAKRQSAIIIAAYMTPDKELTCPSYAHYIGINDFHLSDHRHSYFDANGAKFLGDITLANVGDMTAKDKWMKLNVASSPIEIYYSNGTRPLIIPNTYSLTITTINDNGDTVTVTDVPQGYTVFIYYYGAQGKLNYGPDSVSSGSSLSNLSAPNTVTINNNATNVYKIECVLVKGTSAAANIIDKVNIEYGNVTWFDTDSWCLIPKKEVAYATILDAYNAPTTTANDQRVKLYVSLQYGVGHYVYGAIENGQFDYDASTNPNGFRLVAHVYYQSFGNGVMAEFTNNNITWTKSNNDLICTFEVPNYLQTLHNNQYLDYMDNYKNNRQKNPVMIQVELVKGSEVLDSRTVYVSMQSGAIQKLTDNSWVSAISSSKQYTDDRTGPLGEAIDANTQAIQNNTSLIEQTATGIRDWVSENYATTSALDEAISQTVENLESEINQTAYGITSAVSSEFDTVYGAIDGITGELAVINGEITGINGAIDGITGDIERLSEDLGTQITQTAGMIRSEAKRSYWHSGSHLDSSDPSTPIDLTSSSYAQNRYYCVTITPSDHSYTKKHVYNFQVERERGTEADWGKPNWGSQSEPYGVDLMLNWTIITGAGNNWRDAQKYVNEYYLQYANGKVIGDIGIDDGAYETYFYVRGGSKYVVRYSEAATVSILSDDYDTRITNEPVIYTPTESEILQTADEIYMHIDEIDAVTGEQLKTTGIDITNGKIELTADNTIINGNLNVIESGQTGEQEGITLYDSDNNARVNILANNIPDPTDPNSTFSAYNNFNIESDWTTKTTSDNVNITTSKRAIGTFSNGSTLTMYIYPKITGYVNGSTSIVNNVPGTISCTLNLYKDGGSSVSNTLTQSISVGGGNPRHYPRTAFTINNLAAGSYEAEINITGDDSTNRYVNYKIICDTSFYKISDSLTYLGLDGLLVGTSENNYAKISKDGYEFRYTDTGVTGENGVAFRMNESGLQRAYNIGSTGPIDWVGFDGYNKATVLTCNNFTQGTVVYGTSQVTNAWYYMVQPNDSNIFIPFKFVPTGSTDQTGGTLYIVLGNGIGGTNFSRGTGVLPGRKITIQNFTNKTVYVCTGTQYQYILTQKIDSQSHYYWHADGIIGDISMHAYTFITIPTRDSFSNTPVVDGGDHSRGEANWTILNVQAN